MAELSTDGVSGASLRKLRAFRSSPDPLAYEIHNCLRRGSRKKDFRDSTFFQRGNISLRNNSADQNRYVIHMLFAQQVHQSWTKRIVCAGKYAKTNHAQL